MDVKTLYVIYCTIFCVYMGLRYLIMYSAIASAMADVYKFKIQVLLIWTDDMNTDLNQLDMVDISDVKCGFLTFWNPFIVLGKQLIPKEKRCLMKAVSKKYEKWSKPV